jgi:hypothetical protein
MRTLSAGSTRLIGPVASRHSLLPRALLVCGILSALVWLVTDIVASLRYAGYNYPFDPISGLCAVGAPTRPAVVLFDNLYVVLQMAFAIGVWMSAGTKRALRVTAALLFAAGVVGLVSNWFPWDPAAAARTFGNVMHAILSGALTVLFILWIVWSGRGAGGRWFRLYTYGTLLVFVVVGALSSQEGSWLMAGLPPRVLGVTERVNAYGYMLWVIVLAIVLLRAQPDQ